MASNNTTNPARNARKRTLSESLDKDEKEGFFAPRKISKIKRAEDVGRLSTITPWADEPVRTQVGIDPWDILRQMALDLEQPKVTVGDVGEASTVAAEAAPGVPEVQSSDFTSDLTTGNCQSDSVPELKTTIRPSDPVPQATQPASPVVEAPATTIAAASPDVGIVNDPTLKQTGHSALAAVQTTSQDVGMIDHIPSTANHAVRDSNPRTCPICVTWGLSGHDNHHGRPCTKRFRKSRRLEHRRQWEENGSHACLACKSAGLVSPDHPPTCCNAALREEKVQSLKKKRGRHDHPHNQSRRLRLDVYLRKVCKIVNPDLRKKYFQDFLEPLILEHLDREEIALIFCALLYQGILDQVALLLLSLGSYT